MEVVKYNPDIHRDMVLSWFDKRDWDKDIENLFSDSGYIIDDRCATWAYMSNSSLCMLGWTVGNPDISRKILYISLEKLINHVKCQVGKLGYTNLFAYTDISGLSKLYEKCGFVVCETNMTNLIARL